MNPDAFDHLELGKKKFFRYDRKGAAEEFRKALSLELDNSSILGWLAIAFVTLKENDEAMKLIKDRINNDCAEFYIANGLAIKLRNGDKNDVILQYSKAISIDSSNELPYVLRAHTYAETNRNTEAISDINSALNIKPNAYVLTHSGLVKEKLKDLQGALADFNKAIEHDSTFSRAWANRALVRKNLGEMQKALADFDKAIELDPRYVWVLYQRGNLKNNFLNDKQGAITDYDKAIEIDPGHIWALANRGKAQDDLGDFQAALADYDKAIELDPNYVWALYKRGVLKQTSLNDKRGALADYNKTIKLDPTYKWALANRGNVRIDLDDIKGALADFDKAIELDPSYVFAINCRGNLKYRFLNDKQGALIDFNNAIELDPSYKWAWANRGSIKAEIGDKQEALDNLNRALEIDKNYSWVLKKRANIFESLGQYELSLADRSRYYELEGIPRFKYEDSEKQDVFDSVYAHFHESIKPEISGNGEKFVEYWECFLYWGDEELQSLHKGRTTYTLTGKYGMGYVCLTDRFLRIISMSSLSKKYGKNLGLGLGKKMFLALLSNFDFRNIEKEDKLWAIPFRDIQGISREDGAFHIVAPKEDWEVIPYWAEEEYMHTALELARTGNLRKLINVEKLRISPKQSNSDDKIFEKIERLASLREKEIITPEEFEQKKKELLARI